MSEANAEGKVRRSKRLALSDISNVVQRVINYGDRAPKKRRTTSQSSSANECKDNDQPSAESEDVGFVDPDQSVDLHPLNTTVSSQSSQLTADDEYEIFGFNQPRKIMRRFPLPLKGASPADCYEVIDDMYAFFNAKQVSSMARPNFSQRTEITSRMRTILVDWLIEVHYKYVLFPATLWLCVNILDRYIERVDFPRNELQLVGITALLIACKFEEFRAPLVNDFVVLTDSAYQREEILKMEFKILEALDYELLVPTAFHFLQRFLYRIRASERLRLWSSFFAERNIQEPDFFAFKPSVYAAASLYLGIKAIHLEQGVENEPIWSASLVEESSLQEKDIIDCASRLLYNARQTPVSSSKRKLEAVNKKYNTKQTQYIAQVPLPSV